MLSGGSRCRGSLGRTLTALATVAHSGVPRPGPEDTLLFFSLMCLPHPVNNQLLWATTNPDEVCSIKCLACNLQNSKGHEDQGKTERDEKGFDI